MLNNQQLNSKAMEAQGGCGESLWEVKYAFHEYIHGLSDRNRNEIGSQSSFEEECFKMVEESVKVYRPDGGDFSKLLVRNLTRRLAQTKQRFSAKRRGIQVMPIPQETTEEGFMEIPLVDDLAIVDGNFLLKEKIAGLAAGDSRKLLVLNSMTDLGFNELQTAKLLAQHDGKKVDTHRKFIQRFRKDCQVALAHAN